MTSSAVAPWAAFGPPAGGFYADESDLPGLPYGQLIRLRREEAVARAEEARLESERQDRADARQAAALWQAKQYTLEKGLPWDERHPFKHTPSVIDRANALFNLQDAQQRDADRRALREAGLEHLLGDLPVPPPPPVASPGDAPPTSRSRALPSTSGVARANPVATKIRAAFARWATRSSGHRSTGCGCAACDPDAVRTEVEYPEITRSFDTGTRIR